MMNLVDLQNKLRNLSQEQLVQQMQTPSGDVPQFLLLSEITRRQKMRDSFAQEQNEDQSSVAQDAIAAAGMPAEFAAQMAGSMAPQTNMQGNTGAMPQAQAVRAMAGGGIVALREGGEVRAPRTFVRDGMVFIVNERGEEVPWAPVSQVEGMDMPSPTYQPMGSVNPSFSEERSPRSALAASREPAAPYTPMLGDVDALFPTDPVADLPFAGALVPPSGPSRVADRLPLNQAAVAIPGIAPAPMSMPSVSDAVRALEEYYPGSGYADVMRGGPRMPPQSVSEVGSTVDSNVNPMLDFQENFNFDGDGGVSPGAMERIFGAPALERIGVGTTRTRMDDELAPGSAPLVDPQAAAAADIAATSDPTTTALGPLGPSGGGGGGGGGGIAALSGAAAPSSYEQQLLDMLGAREKRAEQDKWLSLAQFGLQLMSSKEPTLGGAIGEAGGPALESLRSGRQEYDADRLGLLNTLEQYRMGQAQFALSQQAAAARAAAGSRGGGGRPIPASVLTAVNRQIADLQEQLPMAMSNPAQRDAIEQEIKRLNAISNQVLSTYGLGLGVGQDAGYDLDFQ
jgi:hypothetical protein